MRYFIRSGIWCCVLIAAFAATAKAQTPSPLQEWQYSRGLILERMFVDEQSEVRAVAGLGSVLEPLYDGSRAYRVRAGPALDLRVNDRISVSTGEGLAFAVVHKRGFEVWTSIAYDLGRKVRDDYDNLRGLGDKRIAAVPKVSASWVLSERFPMVLRADFRHLLRSGGGNIGDLSAYMPLPGSSSRFVMFAGPSVTFANGRYLDDMFGITAQQSQQSGHPAYWTRHGELEAFGLGFSATWNVARHVMVNADAAANRLGRWVVNSPIDERASGRALALSIEYRW